MKLQFSLATQLVCMTVLAVVAALCAQTKFVDLDRFPPIGTYRTLNGKEFVWRMAFWGPVSIAATLIVLWAFREPRPPNRPPVG